MRIDSYYNEEKLETYTYSSRRSDEVLGRTQAYSVDDARLQFAQRKALDPRDFHTIYSVQREELPPSPNESYRIQE
jgi:hypothetical protein